MESRIIELPVSKKLLKIFETKYSLKKSFRDQAFAFNHHQDQKVYAQSILRDTFMTQGLEIVCSIGQAVADLSQDKVSGLLMIVQQLAFT